MANPEQIAAKYAKVSRIGGLSRKSYRWPKASVLAAIREAQQQQMEEDIEVVAEMAGEIRDEEARAPDIIAAIRKAWREKNNG
jgi:methyl coenzyme M reductase subunit C-like uncharacterized protein (methanogenesis marker protein 7)